MCIYNYIQLYFQLNDCIELVDKNLGKQLAPSLLTVCSRFVIIKQEQAMQTHPDIGLMTARQQAQCCQVNFPKNPNIALKKSQDSLFFPEKSQDSLFFPEKSQDSLFFPEKSQDSLFFPEKSQDSHFHLLTSFQVPLIAWSDHYTQQISNIKSKWQEQNHQNAWNNWNYNWWWIELILI